MEAKQAAPRFSLELPMRYRRKGETQWRRSQSQNISSSGALFATTEMLPPGSVLEMEISMSAGTLKPTRVSALSEVVRQIADDIGLMTSVRHLRYEMRPDNHISDWTEP
jgi:hypothetical protein